MTSKANKKTVEFATLIQLAREGDSEAAYGLLQEHEGFLRTVVRQKLKDGQLRRIADSIDICQSVLTDLISYLQQGKLTLQSSEQLRSLLATMAVNKIIDKVRHEARHLGGKVSEECIVDTQPSPDRTIDNQEIINQANSHLSDKERWLVEQRVNGATWEAIAKKVKSTPDAVRMMHRRALERLREEFSKPF